MLEALNTACIIAPIAAIIFLVLDLVRRGATQILLCMECEQCAGACPVTLKAGADFIGPRGIMAAAKVGDPSRAIIRGALLCNGCKACERVCPRGLAPYQEVTRWKASMMSTASGESEPAAPKVFRTHS
ncbi:MAG: 4Fe-4S dicluster domain-containing protein [Syntrophobacter sp.]